MKMKTVMLANMILVMMKKKQIKNLSQLSLPRDRGHPLIPPSQDQGLDRDLGKVPHLHRVDHDLAHPHGDAPDPAAGLVMAVLGQGQAVIQTPGHARGDIHHHVLDQDPGQALMISMSRRNVDEEEVLW